MGISLHFLVRHTMQTPAMLTPPSQPLSVDSNPYRIELSQMLYSPVSDRWQHSYSRAPA